MEISFRFDRDFSPNLFMIITGLLVHSVFGYAVNNAVGQSFLEVTKRSKDSKGTPQKSNTTEYSLEERDSILMPPPPSRSSLACGRK